MSDKEVILTQDGLKKLEDELENLKSVKRREVAELGSCPSTLGIGIWFGGR